MIVLCSARFCVLVHVTLIALPRTEFGWYHPKYFNADCVGFVKLWYVEGTIQYGLPMLVQDWILPQNVPVGRGGISITVTLTWTYLFLTPYLINHCPVKGPNVEYLFLGCEFSLFFYVKRTTSATEIARDFGNHFQIYLLVRHNQDMHLPPHINKGITTNIMYVLPYLLSTYNIITRGRYRVVIDI